jgi:hypothetical protein
MLNKEEICVIISSYPQTHLDSTLLSLTHESFSRQGYDICLVSHAPVNNDLQKASKYYIYSDENQPLKFPEPSSLTVFFTSEDIHYQTNWGNVMGSHSLSILNNLKNALYLLRHKKYKSFIFIDSDTFLTKNDHDILESKLAEFSFNERDYWFMIESNDNGAIIPVTSFFGGNIEYFHNILKQVNTEEDYFNICKTVSSYTLESLFSALFCVSPSENGHLDHSRPRDIFSSKWLGISTFGNADIPELENKFNVDIDIVRDKNSDENVYYILFFHPKNEIINLKFYKDDLLVQDFETTTGAIHYWMFTKDDTQVWKIEAYYGGKLLKSLERTTEEIFWNKFSFFENKKWNSEIN